MDKSKAMKVMAEAHRETVRELEAVIEAMDEQRIKMGKSHQNTLDSASFLLDQNNKYREALEFYAKEEIYEFETVVSDCDIEVESKALDDYGKKAREALASGCIHCNGKGFNGLDYCTQCNQREDES